MKKEFLIRWYTGTSTQTEFKRSDIVTQRKVRARKIDDVRALHEVIPMMYRDKLAFTNLIKLTDKDYRCDLGGTGEFVQVLELEEVDE